MKLFGLLILAGVIANAQNLKSTPCKYLMPGEVLESSANSDGRYCIINTQSEPSTSYLIQIVTIIYANNQIYRDNYVAMPICPLSKISLFNKGNHTDFMVDTLNETSWMKRLYKRTCQN